MTKIRPFAVLLLLMHVAAPFTASAQEPKVLHGQEILAHPVGKLAVQMAGLLVAGKVEEVFRLRTKEAQADWKNASARDRQELAARLKERAPDPKALRDSISKEGELTVQPDRANLIVPMAGGATAIAYFELEDGNWRGTSGPMVIPGETKPTSETRVQGADILKHPVGELALRYVDAIHAGHMDEAMKMASTQARSDWKALPASERAESAAYRKKTLPNRKELVAGIESGGLLIIEDDTRATLNVVQTVQTSTEPGVVSSSSTTIFIPFVLEGGDWKLAQ